MTLFEQFIEKVKEGKISFARHEPRSRTGLEAVATELVSCLTFIPQQRTDRKNAWKPIQSSDAVLLCYEIRRWLTSKGWLVNLTLAPSAWSNERDELRIAAKGGKPVRFNEGLEIDWHIEAVLFVLEQP